MSVERWQEKLQLGGERIAFVWTVRGLDASVFFSPTPATVTPLTRASVEAFARSMTPLEGDRVAFVAPGVAPETMAVSRAQGEALIELLRAAAKFAGA